MIKVTDLSALKQKRESVMIIVEIAGFLGTDAEERVTPNGKKVISLRVAAKVRHGGQEETVWWKVSIWNDRYEKMLPYLKKGSAVIVIGEMGKPETYTDKDGNIKTSLTMNGEIVKFSPFGKSEKSQGSDHESSRDQGSEVACGVSSEDGFTEDDLPF